MSQEQETALYDQPALYDYDEDHGPVTFGDASVAAELEGMRIKPSRKEKRKAKREKSLREIAEGLSQPQYIMREEILGNKHHGAHSDEDELTPYGRFDRDVPGLAAEICDRHPMNLGRAQWLLVQEMVEEALRVGFAAAQGGRG